jgi:hypothetical protein
MFPSGDSRPIAVLEFSPDELATRLGIVFEKGYDDFDSYELAAIEIRPADSPDIGQVWLFRYQGWPYPGTELLIDSLEDGARILPIVLDALSLSEHNVSWNPLDL